MSPWVKISDSYRDDVRLARVSADAEAVFFRLLAASNRTLADGWLHEALVRQEAAARISLDTIDAVITALLDVRLLEHEGDGYRLAPDIVAEQPTREDVERKRAMWREQTKRRRSPKKPRRPLQRIV